MQALGRHAAALAALLVLALAATAQARPLHTAFRDAQPPDPSRNIPIDYASAPYSCHTDGRGAACQSFAIGQLNRSRARMGLPSYRLPPHFLSLAPGAQVLVLTNLDRTVYGLAPVTGINRSLNEAAGSAAAVGADPEPPPGFFTNLQEAGYAGNWAAGMPNILLAYDVWMYDDGYNAGNISCPTPTSDGCWGHRHDIFAFPTMTATAMGIAVSRWNGMPSYTQLIVATYPQPAPAAHLSYSATWSSLSRGLRLR